LGCWWFMSVCIDICGQAGLRRGEWCFKGYMQCGVKGWRTHIGTSWDAAGARLACWCVGNAMATATGSQQLEQTGQLLHWLSMLGASVAAACVHGERHQSVSGCMAPTVHLASARVVSGAAWLCTHAVHPACAGKNAALLLLQPVVSVVGTSAPVRQSWLLHGWFTPHVPRVRVRNSGWRSVSLSACVPVAVCACGGVCVRLCVCVGCVCV
jgi:hypothetical protein